MKVVTKPEDIGLPTAIGFCGKAGVGKTTTAKAFKSLVEMLLAKSQGSFTIKICPIADEVKSIAMRDFGWDGMKDERGRRLLQVLGTDAGRAYNKDLWVLKWKRKTMPDLSDNSLILVDDVRFQNEVEAIQELGGVVVRLDSSYRGTQLEHDSEKQTLQADFALLADNTPTHLAATILEKVFKTQESTGT